MVEEVGEAFSAWRKGKPDFGEELADVAAFLFGVAEMTGVDLEQEIEAKMQKVRQREYEPLRNGTLVKREPDSATGKWGHDMPCSLAEPCYQDGCGACYPDKVMQQETEREARAMGQLAPLLDPRERTPDLAKGAALEADRAAGYAFRKGDYSRALTWLESARQLDPDLPDLERALRPRACG